MLAIGDWAKDLEEGVKKGNDNLRRWNQKKKP